ncbi:MAG: triose-phosphate isomerase [Chloroflexi bacterium]|nr:triose-phosphate isomerase [Chloroflexota bacterium]MDA8188365.1 triose-phosphate isomerase [Dehalococcoidales bacterium]
MRTPIIAGNWKMNTSIDEAVALVKQMKDALDKISGAEKVLCPPFVSLVSVRELIGGTSIKLGAQNMYFQDKGAYTGEVSPLMLAPLCQYVILGHSERRQYFGETDEIVNKKILSALNHGLSPIVCVGENLKQNEAGKTTEIVTGQIRRGFADVPSIDNVVVAYEPIWAIGTGKPATGAGANQVIGLIRSTMAELYGEEAASQLRIQYGGSVTAANIAEFISQPHIDGGLVGGASLKADEFVAIVAKAAEIKSSLRKPV